MTELTIYFNGNRASIALIAVIAITVLGYAIYIPAQNIAYFISDDAYYYLLTAHHIAAGDGVTFDGHNLTNGFHPQWMLILLPVYYLFNDLGMSLKAVFVTQALLDIAAIILLYNWLKKTIGKFPAVNGTILLFAFYSPIVLMFNGLESSLLLFWVVLLLYLDHKYELLSPYASVKKRLILGILLAGIFTSRLDSAYVLISLAIVKTIWPGLNRRSQLYFIQLVKLYLPTIVIFGLLVSPYFIWNYLYFGHLTPISGSIKNTFPTFIKQSRISFHALPYAPPIALLSIAILYIVLRKRCYLYCRVISNWNQKQTGMMIFALTFGCVMHLMWTRCFMLFGVYQWHFVLYVIPIIYFISLLVDSAVQKFKNGSLKLHIAVSMILLFSVIGYNYLLKQVKGLHHKSRIEAAEWTMKNIPENIGIALSDAGVYAYFNKRTTLNTDGLINSYEFQEAVANEHLLKLFEQQNIKYMADAFTPCDKTQHTIKVHAWKGETYPNAIGYSFTFDQSDAVYESPSKFYRFWNKNNKRCFAIWRIEDAVIGRF